MSDDHSADIHTTGTVAVGGSATGTIESAGDRDWFAVELVAGRTYQLDLQGSPTGHGTLADTFLRRILNSEGNKSHGDGAHRTYNDDFDGSVNSRVTFTAVESGTYYVETSGDRDETGTYTLSVSDVTPQTTPPPDTPPPPDPDAVREGAVDLGDITSLDSVMFPRHSLDGEADAVDYFRFTLSEAKRVGLGLRQLDAAADLVVEDAEGEALHRSEAAGTAKEWISTTLLAGTYYVRVESGAAGQNDYVLRYGVSAADPDEVTALEGALESGPAIRVSDAQAHEEDGVLRFRVTLSEAASGAVTVRYETVAGTAVAGEDYESVSEVLEFEAGQTEKWVEVTLVDDTEEDGGETLTLRLSDAAGGHVEVAEAVGTILNTETPTSVSEPGGEDFDAANTTAGRVLAGETVTGAIASAGDVDWYAVELEAGTTYRVDLLGSLMGGGTLLDPYLRGIYDAEQNLLSGTENDNRNFWFYSSRVEFMPEADATYYIAAGGNGSHTGTYSVSVEAFADDYAPGTNTDGSVAVDAAATGEVEYDHDRDWFAVEVEAGKTYLVDVEGTDTGQGTLGDPWLWGIHDSRGELVPGTMDDDDGEGRNARAVFEPETSGTYYVVASAFNKGTYRVSVSDITDVYADDASTVGAVEVGGTATGCIELAGDRDWFAVTLAGGQHYRIELEGADTGQGTLSDPRVYGIHDSQSTVLAGTTDDDGGEGRNGRVDFAPQADGTYYVSAGGDGTHTGTYRLAVKPRPWELSVSDVEAHESSEEMRFRVVLSWESPTPVTVRYETVAGTAVAGEDYESASEVLTFAPGETEKWVGVRIYDDFVEDSGETLTLRLSEATGAVVVDSEATGTILNTEKSARTITVGSTVDGRIRQSGEIDCFEVTLEGGQPYRFDMEANGFFDPTIFGISDELGRQQLGSGNDNYDLIGSANFDSRVFFTPKTGGTYYVATGSAGNVEVNGRVIDTGKYRFSVKAVADDDYGDQPRDATPGATQPGSLTVGSSVTGTIELPNDVDWFAVELEADQAYRFDLKGSPRYDGKSPSVAEGTLVDPYIRGIYDSDGTYQGDTSNDNELYAEPHAGGSSNASIHWTPEASGTYYVAAGAAGSSVGTYRLHATAVADDYLAGTSTTGAVTVDGTTAATVDYVGDVDWFAVTLTAGRAYRVDMTCDLRCDAVIRGIYDSDGDYISKTTNGRFGLFGRDSRVFFMPDTDDTYYIAVTADPGNCNVWSIGSYELSVADVTDVDDYAANKDTSGVFSPLSGWSRTSRVQGEFERAGDVDWFKVVLDAGTTYRLDVNGWDSNSATATTSAEVLDAADGWYTGILPAAGTYGAYRTGFYNSDGDLLAGTMDDDGGSGVNGQVMFTPEVRGTYFVAVGADEEWPAGTYGQSYSLSMTSEVSPDDYAAGTETTGSVSVGGTQTGSIESTGDRDWFEMTLEADKTYQIDLKGRHHGGTLYNPELRGIHDSNGDFISGTHDHDSGRLLDSRLFFTPKESGTYYAVADSAGHTRMNTFYGASGTGTYVISLREVPDDDYSSNYGTLTVGGTATGEIERPEDRDYFTVTLEAGKTYRVDLEGSSTDKGTISGTKLAGVYDSDFGYLSGTWDNSASANTNSRVTFTADESGTHYILAGGWWDLVGTYELSVEEVL